MSDQMGVDRPIEVTVVMPCLNEARTVATCVGKALACLDRLGVSGEVVVADNGSTDGSQELAVAAGARVVPVETRGYGAAIRGGIENARGEYVIMGDADDSYDFTRLDPFIEQLRGGADLVMGNRFKGGIGEGAMPALHRYLGNPVLSFIGRLFFRTDIGDFHCGLRGFRRDKALALGLQTTGMEFASELVVRSVLAKYDVREVPTTLQKDGRDRPPHLRSWRDGWRHLRFLLLYSPRWLFLVPGLVLMVLGAIGTGILLNGPVTIGDTGFDTGSLLYSAAALLIGFQAVTFAFYTKIYAIRAGLLPHDPRIDRVLSRFSLETGLVAGLLLVVVGIAAAVVSVLRWSDAGFGSLDPAEQVRVVVPAVLGVVLGVSIVLGSFFVSILLLETGRAKVGAAERELTPR